MSSWQTNSIYFHSISPSLSVFCTLYLSFLSPFPTNCLKLSLSFFLFPASLLVSLTILFLKKYWKLLNYVDWLFQFVEKRLMILIQSLSLELSIRTTLDLVQLSSIEWLSFKKVVSLSLLSLRIFLTSAPLVHECRWLCIIAFIPNDMNKPEVGFYIEKCSSAASEWNMFTIAGIIISCC